MKNIIFLGAPFAGKNTQVCILNEKLKCLVFEAGQKLRDEKKSGSKLGKEIASHIDQGHNVPPKIIIDITKKFVNNHPGESIIFDDIPRSIEQKALFDTIMKEADRDFVVIYIELSKENALKRVAGRKDKRKDDDPEAIAERFRVFHGYIDPVLEAYEKEDKLIRINGNQTVEKVAEDISNQLNQIQEDDE